LNLTALLHFKSRLLSEAEGKGEVKS
jgi:hypothetical protein